MQLDKQEKQTLSTAIDQLNEGINTVITLYNESTENQPIIPFDEETIQLIEKAKEAYGEKEIAKRISTILKEVFAFLPENK